MSAHKVCPTCKRRMPDSFPTLINLEECARMYQSGASYKDIAKAAGASYEFIRERLQALGVTSRSRGRPVIKKKGKK